MFSEVLKTQPDGAHQGHGKLHVEFRFRAARSQELYAKSVGTTSDFCGQTTGTLQPLLKTLRLRKAQRNALASKPNFHDGSSDVWNLHREHNAFKPDLDEG
jgi:hypothetical protein